MILLPRGAISINLHRLLFETADFIYLYFPSLSSFKSRYFNPKVCTYYYSSYQYVDFSKRCLLRASQNLYTWLRYLFRTHTP